MGFSASVTSNDTTLPKVSWDEVFGQSKLHALMTGDLGLDISTVIFNCRTERHRHCKPKVKLVRINSSSPF